MTWWLPVTKALNRLGVPYPALNFTVSCCLNVVVEIKFEVTNRCNLACSFCHQNFGAKGGTRTLDRDIYDRVLAAAKSERIPAIRLTGGEPLLLKSISEYLRRAKDLGFAVIVNTNGTALTEKRLREMQGLVDWFKISLPAADEPTTTRLTGNRTAWSRKWEAIGLLEKYGCNTDILTVMTSENIQRFDNFINLLEPHELLHWKPLRAETQEGTRRPVTRDEIRTLAAHIAEARRRKRWSALALGLATPFCALENPYDALDLFSGGRTCGPVQSLTVTPEGSIVRCYSRRDPVDIGMGLRKASRMLAMSDFDRLPRVCQHCPLSPLCRGGCLCDWALEGTPFGMIDYLADPARMARPGELPMLMSSPTADSDEAGHGSDPRLEKVLT